MTRAALALVLVLLSALPAWAGDAKEFDLGFAKLGALQGQLRFAVWPPGTNFWCGDDFDRPKEVEKLLSLPKQIQALGAVRCGLFAQDANDQWKLAAVRHLGGSPTQIMAMFAPDDEGKLRLSQLMMEQSIRGYEGMVGYLTARFGPPRETTTVYTRWVSSKGEAVVMHENGPTAMTVLVDSETQNAMNAKLARKTIEAKAGGDAKPAKH